jgi:hypothetical protein
MGEGDTFLNAAIGAVVTVVFSFTGFSPLVGGGVAGYLQRGSRRDGAKVGAISGVLAFLPFVLLLFLGFGFLVAMPMTGGFGLPGFVELLVILLVIFPLLLLWNVGLGAVGGYLGIYLREELAGSNGTTATP